MHVVRLRALSERVDESDNSAHAVAQADDDAVRLVIGEALDDAHDDVSRGKRVRRYGFDGRKAAFTATHLAHAKHSLRSLVSLLLTAQGENARRLHTSTTGNRPTPKRRELHLVASLDET